MTSASARSGSRTRRPSAPPAPVPAPDPAAIAAACEPEKCPCDDKQCSLSRYSRATRAAASPAQLRGDTTLEATEAAVADRLSGLQIDVNAMAAVSNIYRAASAVRNHVERTVLAEHGLAWTAWVVLWVVWIWGEIETRHVAAEAGISKGTLTGVASTLAKGGWLRRRTHPDDARRALLSLTPEGEALMADLFPKFNAAEVEVTSRLSDDERLQLARSLRAVVRAATDL